MGIFGTAYDTAITEEIETATPERNVNVDENWSLIMTICDKAGRTSDNAKAYFRGIIKRLYHEDPHVAVKAVTLLDACVKNSGKVFHVQVASREFEYDFSKLMNKSHHTVSKKLRASLCKWAENEFKSDPELNLIPFMYTKLKNKGLDCSSTDMTETNETEQNSITNEEAASENVEIEKDPQSCTNTEDIVNTSKQRGKKPKRDGTIDEAYEILQQCVAKKPVKSINYIYGQYVASKLDGYSDNCSNIVQHLINNILFEADMGKYDTSPSFLNPHVRTAFNTTPSPHSSHSTDACSSGQTFSGASIPFGSISGFESRR